MKRMNFRFSLMTGIKTITMVLAVLLMVFTFSCEDVNSIHQQYLNRGESIYIGAADSIIVHPGNHKIKFEWKINSDPRISKAVIYWNRRDTSVTIPVSRIAAKGDIWLETQLNNMKEGEYIFEFEMQDNNGNISRAMEIYGGVLGDVYIENLRSRGIKELRKLETGQMQITWEAVNSPTLQYSEVEYLNTLGEKVVVKVLNTDDKTLLQGLNSGDNVKLYAIHLPDSGIENFMSPKVTYVMPKFERELRKTRFVAAFKPGDNTTPHPGNGDQDYLKQITDFSVGMRSLAKIWDGGALNNIDGKTIMHTEDQTGQGITARFKFPHHFTIDIGGLAILNRIRIWPRGDVGAFTGHSPRFFEVWAADVPRQLADFATKAEFEAYYRNTYVVQKDPSNYLASGNATYTDKLTQANSSCMNFITPNPAPGLVNWQQEWVKLGDFEVPKPSALVYGQMNDADKAAWAAGAEFKLNEIGKKVRYIRIVIKFPTWQNTNCINLGEISLFGDDL